MPAAVGSESRAKIAIIGGGIGGICTALGLLQNPLFDVHVYEAWRDFGDVGAGVAFGPNAIRALRMISEEAYKVFWKLSTPNLAAGKQDVFFDVDVGEGPRAGETVVSMRNETGQRSFHRARILEALGPLIPPENCHFDSKLAHMETTEEGYVLHFEDGSVVRTDCVIGADGIHSQTRKHLFGYRFRRYEPQFTGTVGYRCLAPMDQAREVLGDDALRSLWIYGRAGPLTIYPIEDGRTLNMVGAYTQMKSWEGPWVRPTEPGETTKAFGSYKDQLSPKILAVMETFHPKAFSLWDLPELPTYVKGNLALVGDAAHASTPFQASGAGQAVEDALVLTRLLNRVTCVDEVPAALRAYDQIRRPRATRCSQSSLEAGELSSMRLPGYMDNVDKYAVEQERRMQWIWNVDHDHEIRKAEKALEKEKLRKAFQDH